MALLFRRRLFPVLGLVTLGVLGLYLTGFSSKLPGTFVDGYWLDFAAGIGVYVARDRKSVAALTLALLVGIALHWKGLWITDNLAHAHRTVACAFAIALLALRRFDDAIADARWLKPLQWCGVMCFSLYLVHWPLVKGLSHALHAAGVRGHAATLFVTVPTCLTTSLAIAAAFFLLVERRFLNSTQAVRIREEIPAAAGIVVPAADDGDVSVEGEPASRAMAASTE